MAGGGYSPGGGSAQRYSQQAKMAPGGPTSPIARLGRAPSQPSSESGAVGGLGAPAGQQYGFGGQGGLAALLQGLSAYAPSYSAQAHAPQSFQPQAAPWRFNLADYTPPPSPWMQVPPQQHQGVPYDDSGQGSI